jgi:hypothetical protein
MPAKVLPRAQTIAARCLKKIPRSLTILPEVKAIVDVTYAAPQAHRIVNVALHWEYSLGIIFTFSQGRKYLNHV